MDYLIRLESRNQFSVVKYDNMPLATYHVFNGVRGMKCSCPHNVFRKTGCKHIDMVLQCKALGTPQPFVVER